MLSVVPVLASTKYRPVIMEDSSITIGVKRLAEELLDVITGQDCKDGGALNIADSSIQNNGDNIGSTEKCGMSSSTLSFLNGLLEEGEECLSSYPVPCKARKIECSDDQPTKPYDWRDKALSCLNNPSEDVFVLEAYIKNEVLLQVKVSRSTTTLLMNTWPWSLSTGESILEDAFRASLEETDGQVEDILKLKSTKFSPSILVKFILINCNYAPILLSSNYSSLFNDGTSDKHFMEYFVYQKILPGSQNCRYPLCTSTACAIMLNEQLDPAGIFCAKHVCQNGIYDRVLLYNPLMISFTVHKNKMVLSAMNMEGFFGARKSIGEWGNNTTPYAIPLHWITLCRKKQRKVLKATTPMDMMIETAINVLECADEHLYPGKRHQIGVEVRHSLTCCLFEAFLATQCIPCRLPIPSTELDKEDYPYDW